MAKLPSTRFPFINLAKSLERAEKVFNADKPGKGLSQAVLFSAWGYSDKSSGGFQTVGALRGYGLIAADTSKEAKLVRLTDKARHYFQTEIKADRSALEAEFAATPALFGHLLEHWGHGTVDDAVARTYLKTVIGLNDQSARAALGIYKDNLAFASTKGSVKVVDEATDDAEDEEAPPNPQLTVGDLVCVEADGQLIYPKTRIRAIEGEWVFVEASKSGAKMSNVTLLEKGAERETPPERPFDPPADSGKIAAGEEMDRFTVDEGVVKITFPSGMTPESVDELEQFLQLFIKKAKRRASRKYDL